MAVLKMMLGPTEQGYDNNNTPNLWIAKFRFSDSPGEVWEKIGRCDVTAIVTASDSFTNAGGIVDDTVAECKDYVQNKGNHAGQNNYEGKHNSDTWA